MNDNKVTLNFIRQNVPNICVASVPETKNSILGGLRPAMFEIRS